MIYRVITKGVGATRGYAPNTPTRKQQTSAQQCSVESRMVLLPHKESKKNPVSTRRRKQRECTGISWTEKKPSGNMVKAISRHGHQQHPSGCHETGGFRCGGQALVSRLAHCNVVGTAVGQFHLAMVMVLTKKMGTVVDMLRAVVAAGVS